MLEIKRHGLNFLQKNVYFANHSWIAGLNSYNQRNKETKYLTVFSEYD